MPPGYRHPVESSSARPESFSPMVLAIMFFTNCGKAKTLVGARLGDGTFANANRPNKLSRTVAIASGGNIADARFGC